mmetsp:Transcript_766/g.1803  ORF Transcript_766/g.1803 Transcript_766/m.1803 type:complete len:777 (-) Transcript_766:52-2382(-)
MASSRLGPRNNNFFGKGKENEASGVVGGSGRALDERFRAARGSGVLNLTNAGLQELTRDLMLKFGTGCASDESWWSSIACTEIRLGGNQLNHVDPEAFEEIRDTVASVQLDNNDLEDIPVALQALEVLKKLSASHNRIYSLDNCVPWQDLVVFSCPHNEIQVLPQAFAHMDALRVLDIRHNRLQMIEALPRGLEQLLLSDNQLSNLGDDLLSKVPNLQELMVANNCLTYLAVQHLQKVKIIDARQNALERMGPLAHNVHLDQLLIGFNKLVSIRGLDLHHAPNLSVLDLSENKLADLDEESLCGCIKLKMLDVTNNNLSTLPPGLGYMPSIQGLNAIGNPFRGIRVSMLQAGTEKLKAYLRTKGTKPQVLELASAIEPNIESASNMDPLQKLLWNDDRLRDAHARACGSGILNLQGLLQDGGSFTESLNVLLEKHALGQPQGPNDANESARPLVELSLSCNFLTIVPPQDIQPRAWRSLVSLNLEENHLQTIGPHSFSACHHLEELRLRRNQIEKIDFGCSLPHLRILDLRQNKLTALPTCIIQGSGAENKLEELLLGFNQIPIVRTSLSPLRKLIKLDLSNNGLEELPDGLFDLSALEYLNLENGNLYNIPAQLALLSRLQTLLIAGNPQRAIRPHVIAEGSNSLIQYLRSRCPTQQVESKVEKAHPLETHDNFNNTSSNNNMIRTTSPTTTTTTTTVTVPSSRVASRSTPPASATSAQAPSLDLANLEAKIRELEDRIENDISMSAAARHGFKRQLARDRATLLRATRASAANK